MSAHAEWDTRSDTWVAVDALGRSLPGYSTCGGPRPGKYVGIFYFTWLGQHSTGGPYDITKILAENPDDPQWGPEGDFHHWGESELGYYLSNDAYVMRRHCEMLIDAGIDVLFVDVTNAFTYTSNYMLLCSVLQQIRKEGGKTPQMAFCANAGSDVVVQRLYDEFYSKNLYKDLWFMWRGKPLMLADPTNLSPQMKDYFTVRQCWAWSNSWWFPGRAAQHKWTFLDHFPQGYGYDTDPDVPEESSVTVAQHATTNIGRSHQAGKQPDPAGFKSDQGLYFAEQWTRILEPPVDSAEEIDPEIIFITGWNEWVAQRFLSDGTATFLGKTLPAGESYFVDEYTQEYSRDIEPMKGGYTDNYYYQMINYVRRFKGVRPPEVASAPKTITIDGDFADWENVGPEYRDTIGDTAHRNSAGWGEAGTYVNTTGRNDFVKSKVARDDDYVYFYVETAARITDHSGPNWMLLFVDSDRDSATGWHGYDCIVNHPPVDADTTTVKRNTGGWNWSQSLVVPYAKTDEQMELRIPRDYLGLDDPTSATFDFHWADNIQKTDDIIEFCVSGDSAPNRRFNYRYHTSRPGPEVLCVTSDNPDGEYKIGDVIQIRVRFTHPVTVTGTPQLELETGSVDRKADYSSGSGTQELIFSYTVQNGDAATDLDYTHSDALRPNGGTIKDASGVDADLTLAPPGLEYSLSKVKDIRTQRPELGGSTLSSLARAERLLIK